MDHPLAAHVFASEGVRAGLVVRALKREGLNIHAGWSPSGSWADLGRARLDLVIVVEPDGAPHSEDDFGAIRAAAPDAAVVVVCSPERERPQALVWAGVDALVFEPGADAIVGSAARSALAGYVLVPRRLRAALQPPPLTKREREMLALVVEGFTNHEIGKRLFLAESTVKRHLSSTFKRLGVSSRREAVAAVLAAEEGFGMPPRRDPHGH